MSKTTISASATGLPSRRLFLAAGSAAAVFGALGSAAQGGETSELLNLRGIATRYDKDPLNFLAAIKLAAARTWIKAL